MKINYSIDINIRKLLYLQKLNPSDMLSKMFKSKKKFFENVTIKSEISNLMEKVLENKQILENSPNQEKSY